MPTGQVIINNALTALGLLEQGGTASVSDSTDALAELNDLWPSWSIDEGLIYAIVPFSGTLTTATASYTIGAGATFNTPRPSRIYKAYFTLGNNRNELDIVNAQHYYSHNDLAAACATPDEVYLDYNADSNGYGKIYVWPVPAFASGSPQLELEQAVPFAAWALGTNYYVPAGYADAIKYALAWRLIPRFGAAVAQQTVVMIQQLATKAEARLRSTNAFNRQEPQAPVTPQAAQQ